MPHLISAVISMLDIAEFYYLFFLLNSSFLLIADYLLHILKHSEVSYVVTTIEAAPMLQGLASEMNIKVMTILASRYLH